MNYARAAKGTLPCDSILREIDCQCEIDMGRHLDSLEKDKLFSRFPPELVLARIHKVC